MNVKYAIIFLTIGIIANTSCVNITSLPDSFYHELLYKGPDPINNNFFFHSIFFGKDANGKDCYRQILDHMENPAFGKVKLIIFNKARWYIPYSKNSLETLGTYSDTKIHDRFLNKGSKANGGIVWCPLKNAFVAGTTNIEVCNQDLEKDYIVLEKEFTQN